MDPSEYVALFVRYLRSQNLHITNARRKIAELVCRLHGHFDAHRVLAELAEENIAPSTIYRTLAYLDAAGLVRKLAFKDKSLYENAIGSTSHRHLICSKCAKIIEFNDLELEERLTQIASSNSFRSSKIEISLVGICQECS
jgi:Fur family ferric uptake transcriptional regulator